MVADQDSSLKHILDGMMGPNDEESEPFIYMFVLCKAPNGYAGVRHSRSIDLHLSLSKGEWDPVHVFLMCSLCVLYSHWVAVASGGTKELVVSFDAGHSSDDLAANLQTQRQRQCSPHDLKQFK